jgi:5-methyltetrahydrofolate--homocysteine methyltransferase
MATVALAENGKLLTGADIECVATLLESLDVAAYGFNCGLGPNLMLNYVKELSRIATKPIIVKPNAGLPKIIGGKTVFNIDAECFTRHICALAEAGATFIGGCCGTTPQHIASVKQALTGRETTRLHPPGQRTKVSGGISCVELKSGEGLIIGERINPTGKKRLKEAFLNRDTSYILREAVAQCDAGAKILDVNCGVAGIDETEVLAASIEAVQSVANVPVEIDTTNIKALECALRRVNGKPLINSVNGKIESMNSVFPLVKRYGGTVVALCLDENGIPNTADGRIAIAKKILAEGSRWGLTEKDFVFDALTLAVSTDNNAALTTLETVRRLSEELKVNTILGISNVSFALPGRTILNNATYTLARQAGLSAAIANPQTISQCDDEAAFEVLLGKDPNCERWIAKCQTGEPAPATESTADSNPLISLKLSIKRGLKDDAATLSARLIANGIQAIEIIEKAIVPALEEIGRGFETAKVFLPQLLMAADAAGAAFEKVKSTLHSDVDIAGKGRAIVLATVKGDIHDIGKNIVRALLENYGFKVIDLGKDVDAKTIIETAARSNAMMICLSALMTTTLDAMAETTAEAKASNLKCRICVGGAVVTDEYAKSIGADFYAKDAMQAVRFAEGLLAEKPTDR